MGAEKETDMATATPSVELGPQCAWFSFGPHREIVLSSRKPLHAIFRALVEQRDARGFEEGRRDLPGWARPA